MNTNIAAIESSPKWTVVKTGLDIQDSNLTYQECADMVAAISTADTSIKFALADAVVYAREHFPEDYAQMLDEVQVSIGYLNNIIYVAHNVPRGNRSFNVSFSHFYEVASIEDKDEQAEWLRMCEEQRLSRDDLRLRMKGTMLEPGETTFAMPINDRSALQTVLAWLDGRYPLSKYELKQLLERYLNEDKSRPRDIVS